MCHDQICGSFLLPSQIADKFAHCDRPAGELVDDPRVYECRAENAPPSPTEGSARGAAEDRKLDMTGVARGERPKLKG